MDHAVNLRGAASSHIGLNVFFFNLKTTADISKWYKTFSFPLTHSTPPMRLGSYLKDTYIQILTLKVNFLIKAQIDIVTKVILIFVSY